MSMLTSPVKETTETATLLKTLQAAASSLPDNVLQNRTARRELLAAASKLTAALETADEALFRIVFQPHQNAVVRVALQLRLFDIVSKGGEKGTSALELASITGAERLLIARIMRVLVAMGIFAELGPETYISTPIAEAFTIPAFRGASIHLYDEGAASLIKLPEYLESTGWKNPTDSTAGPFQYAFDTKLGLWEFIKGQPQRLNAFNTFMEGQRLGRPQWFDFYPVEETLLPDLKQDDVLLVDVGGGRGHDLIAFHNKYPHHKGRLILQDLPQAVNEAGELIGVEAMPHDFFTPQPVKGARVYYFRNIFHDWPDSACVEILRHTANAMTEGSRVIISEWVILDMGSPLFPTMMDINMMAQLAGMERTKAQWEKLLAEVGLEITKLSAPDIESESVIEAVLRIRA